MMTKTKILFVIDGLRVGGKERRIVELLKVLVKTKEYEIVVYSTRRDILYDEFYNLDLQLFFIVKAESSFLSTAKKLKDGINSFRPQIVHSWSSYAASITIASKLYGAKGFKIVNSQITNVPPKIKRFTKFWFQNKINFFFSDIILSNTLKGIEQYKSPKSKSHCIYNGFDMLRISDLDPVEQIKEKYNLRQEFVIGMIGSFERKKDFHCYIRAAILLLEQRNDIVFFIVGDGSMRDEIEALIPENYKNKIILTGNVKKVENIVQILDIGVLCTNAQVHGEGISNVILEIMAQGKTVIATEGGGTSEIISNMQNGIIILPGDYENLVKTIESLLSNKEKREFLEVNAKNTVIEKFDNLQNNNKYCKLYKSLIK